MRRGLVVRYSLPLMLLLLAVPCTRSAVGDTTTSPKDSTGTEDHLRIRGYAQENKDKVYYLEDVRIEAERINNGVSESVSVPQEKMELRAVRTVAEAIRPVAGLTVATAGKAGTRLSIRGFQDKQILVLMNGQPINSGYYGSVDLSYLPLENVEKVVITRGLASTRFMNAAGGVVDIITPTGRGGERTDGLGLDLDMRIRSNLGYDVAVGLKRTVGGLYLTGSARWLESSGFRLSSGFLPTPEEDGGVRENTDAKRLTFDLQARYDFASDQHITMGVGSTTMEKGVPRAVYEPPRDRFVDWSRYHLRTAAKLRWAKATFKPSVLFSGHSDELLRYDGYPFADSILVFDSVYENWSLNIRNEVSHPLGDGTILSGIEYQANWLHKKPDVTVPKEKYGLDTGNLFVETGKPISEGLGLTAGLGWSFFRNREEDRSSNQLNPVLSMKYDSGGGLTLRASVGRSSAFPSLRNLYSHLRGNPDLETEKMTKLEALAAKSWEGQAYFLRLSLAGYLNRIERLIYLDWTEDTDGMFKNATSRLVNYGFELEGSWGKGGRYYGDLGISGLGWQQGSYDEGEFREIVCYKPRVKAGASLGWKPRPKIELYSEVESYFKRQDELGRDMDDYALFHLTTRYRPNRWQVFYLRIDNLFDTNYAEVLDHYMPGRETSLGMKISL